MITLNLKDHIGYLVTNYRIFIVEIGDSLFLFPITIIGHYLF